MVFDTFDVYIGYYDCNELGKSLADVMLVGDYIKLMVLGLIQLRI
jgi:hypothetical protein